jgi:hypothetical protein
MPKISMMDIKQALKDERFRDSLPLSFKKEVNEFLNNPGCPCNVPLYRRIMKDAKEQLGKYFPDQEITDFEEELNKLSQNNWSVINCSIHELEARLQKLPKGRKQVELARFQDQVTVIINDLDVVF